MSLAVESAHSMGIHRDRLYIHFLNSAGEPHEISLSKQACGQLLAAVLQSMRQLPAGGESLQVDAVRIQGAALSVAMGQQGPALLLELGGAALALELPKQQLAVLHADMGRLLAPRH